MDHNLYIKKKKYIQKINKHLMGELPMIPKKNFDKELSYIEKKNYVELGAIPEIAREINVKLDK